MDTTGKQKILVFQQKGSGEGKIQGILKYGEGLFALEIISIDQALPPVMDDTGDLLPQEMDADLVLDFLEHPDLSHDLAHMCSRRHVPLVASGKKHLAKGVLTPPT